MKTIKIQQKKVIITEKTLQIPEIKDVHRDVCNGCDHECDDMSCHDCILDSRNFKDFIDTLRDKASDDDSNDEF